ncbi:MAG: tRNA epoxyqueuosine(34) reductase QueG [Acidobacteriota bacterium]
MDSGAAAERIKARAREAGFDAAGVAPLAPAPTGAAYLRWLERGDQAGLGYLERNVELRLDPRGLLPGARSALAVALRYAPLVDEPEPPPGDFWPRVARYARGVDYHDLIWRMLGEVARFVESEWPGTRTRVCADTAPLLERDLAVRAGLGAIGKNTNLLHPTLGSYVLLGELLTTLDLPGDSPLSDLCGSCSRCLEACPTGALPEPWRLDARRCISYWTIEHRGEIPDAIARALAERVFGCDACQEVCPWNGGDPPADHPELRLSDERRDLDLVGMLRMPTEELAARIRGSALRRVRAEGLRRNAAHALGGSAAPAARAALAAAAADDPSSVVRSAAARALAAGHPAPPD